METRSLLVSSPLVEFAATHRAFLNHYRQLDLFNSAILPAAAQEVANNVLGISYDLAGRPVKSIAEDDGTHAGYVWLTQLGIERGIADMQQAMPTLRFVADAAPNISGAY